MPDSSKLSSVNDNDGQNQPAMCRDNGYFPLSPRIIKPGYQGETKNRFELVGNHQSKGHDAMHSLFESKPIRVYLERNGETVFYDVSLTAPYLDDQRHWIEPREQMETDGIAANEVGAFLYEWLRQKPVVESVAIDYSGRHYSIAVLVKALSREIMTDLQMSIDCVRLRFRPHSPIISVLGPNQSDSSLLARAGEWMEW